MLIFRAGNVFLENQCCSGFVVKGQRLRVVGINYYGCLLYTSLIVFPSHSLSDPVCSIVISIFLLLVDMAMPLFKLDGIMLSVTMIFSDFSSVLGGDHTLLSTIH